MSINNFRAQSFGTFPGSGNYLGNAKPASLRHLVSTSAAPDVTTFPGAAAIAQSIGKTAENPGSKAKQNHPLALDLGLGIPGEILMMGAAAYGLHRFSASQMRSKPVVSRENSTAQNTVDESPASAVAAKISPAEERLPLLDRQEPKSPTTQNAASLKSALRPSRDRTFPTPRNGSEPPRVRFADAEPEVREYSPFESGEEKPLKHKKSDLGKTRKKLSPEELAERLKIPDTTGMSEAEKMLVAPIRNQKSSDAAVKRAHDPKAMAKRVDYKYKSKVARVAKDDLRLLNLTKAPGKSTSEKAHAFLKLGIKYSWNKFPITQTELVTQKITRNLSLYKAANIAHEHLESTNPHLSDVEREKLDSIRREASFALDQRIKEKENTFGDTNKAKTTNYRELLEKSNQHIRIFTFLVLYERMLTHLGVTPEFGTYRGSKPKPPEVLCDEEDGLKSAWAMIEGISIKVFNPITRPIAIVTVMRHRRKLICKDF